MKTMSFTQWLTEQLKNKGWSQADLAKKAGISRGTVTNLLTGNRKPGPDACTAIAHALNLPPTTVFRKAGLLPEKPESNFLIDKLIHLVSKLPQEEIEDLADSAEAKLERLARNKKAKQAKTSNSTP